MTKLLLTLSLLASTSSFAGTQLSYHTSDGAFPNAPTSDCTIDEGKDGKLILSTSSTGGFSHLPPRKVELKLTSNDAIRSTAILKSLIEDASHTLPQKNEFIAGGRIVQAYAFTGKKKVFLKETIGFENHSPSAVKLLAFLEGKCTQKTSK